MAGKGGWGASPSGEPSLMVHREEERWRQFNNSVNAVSFGFVATAVLILMFLVMAVFERFLRPRSVDNEGRGMNSASGIVEASRITKIGSQSPAMSTYAREVSVLMPGQDVPTFIAQPAPMPCPPERIAWPCHHQNLFNALPTTHGN